MGFDTRSLAVATAGFCAFVSHHELYAGGGAGALLTGLAWALAG